MAYPTQPLNLRSLAAALLPPAGDKQEKVAAAEKSSAAFVMRLLHAATSAHILHLRSRSFAEHKALDELYSGLPGLVDGVVEAWQGKNGLIEDYPAEYTLPPESALEFVESLSKFVEDERKSLGDDSEIQNAIDEIVTLIDTTRYKLRFLK
jgi:hypothetical protein